LYCALKFEPVSAMTAFLHDRRPADIQPTSEIPNVCYW